MATLREMISQARADGYQDACANSSLMIRECEKTAKKKYAKEWNEPLHLKAIPRALPDHVIIGLA